MKKDEFWAVIDGRGSIWPWTISWWRYDAITAACKTHNKHGMTRKSGWAKIKREYGCRIAKVQLREIK